jgi:putative oxidoreductase
MKNYIEVFARILLAQIFVVAAFVTISQITGHPDGYDAYTAYFGAHGLPGIFAPLTILIQVVFGLGLLLGFKTKICAYVLAGYALFFAFFIKMQEVNGLIFVLQYMAIAGGLIMVGIHDKMALALDNLKKQS